MTTGVDAQGNLLPSVDHFTPDQPRIYCYVAVTSPKPISIGVRWFYEDQLFFNYAQAVDIQEIFYIQPLPGEKFKEGKYRVEIYFVDKAIRTLNFTVGN